MSSMGFSGGGVCWAWYPSGTLRSTRLSSQRFWMPFSARELWLFPARSLSGSLSVVWYCHLLYFWRSFDVVTHAECRWPSSSSQIWQSTTHCVICSYSRLPLSSWIPRYRRRGRFLDSSMIFNSGCATTDIWRWYVPVPRQKPDFRISTACGSLLHPIPSPLSVYLRHWPIQTHTFCCVSQLRIAPPCFWRLPGNVFDIFEPCSRFVDDWWTVRRIWAWESRRGRWLCRGRRLKIATPRRR